MRKKGTASLSARVKHPKKTQGDWGLYCCFVVKDALIWFTESISASILTLLSSWARLCHMKYNFYVNVVRVSTTSYILSVVAGSRLSFVLLLQSLTLNHLTDILPMSSMQQGQHISNLWKWDHCCRFSTWQIFWAEASGGGNGGCIGPKQQTQSVGTQKSKTQNSFCIV